MVRTEEITGIKLAESDRKLITGSGEITKKFPMLTGLVDRKNVSLLENEYFLKTIHHRINYSSSSGSKNFATTAHHVDFECLCQRWTVEYIQIYIRYDSTGVFEAVANLIDLDTMETIDTVNIRLSGTPSSSGSYNVYFSTYKTLVASPKKVRIALSSPTRGEWYLYCSWDGTPYQHFGRPIVKLIASSHTDVALRSVYCRYYMEDIT